MYITLSTYLPTKKSTIVFTYAERQPFRPRKHLIKFLYFRMCELRAKLKKKEKKIAKRDAGFFIGRGVKKLLEICKKKTLKLKYDIRK